MTATSDPRYVFTVSHRAHPGADVVMHVASKLVLALAWLAREAQCPQREQAGYYCIVREQVDAPEVTEGLEVVGFYAPTGERLPDQPDIPDPRVAELRATQQRVDELFSALKRCTDLLQVSHVMVDTDEHRADVDAFLAQVRPLLLNEALNSRTPPCT